MEETTLAKDREVEVCTDEEGFEGAWFGAVLEEDPMGRTEVRVRYTTLLTDDGLSPLTEIIDPKLIRPVPPENLYSGVVLEEGMVVDADHRDAWWTGLVIKKKLEDDNYLVSFESPPDILQFERKQLRAHLQWTGSEWVRPDIQELDKSMFCSGTMVEVSSVKLNKGEITWFPAMIVKEIEEEDGEKIFIVKDCNRHLRSYNGDEVARPNKTVDACRVRPTPPPSSVEEYGLLECVEVFHGSVWRKGIVTRILSERRYRVSLKATKEEFEFKHSDLRPLKVWEDGVWHNGAKCQQNPVKETLDNVIKSKPTPKRSSSGAKPVTCKRTRKHVKISSLKDNGETVTETETVAVTGEVGKKRVDAVRIDKTPLVIMTPQVTPIARGSVSPVTPSPVITATPLKQTETETKGNKSSEIGLGNDSTPHKLPEEENSQDKSRKRKRDEKQHSDLNATDKTCNGSNAEDDIDDQPLATWIGNLSTGVSSDQSSNVMMDSAAEETPPAKDTLAALPFEKKKSPYWKTLESLKSIPQRPHFSPLLEAKDDFREWAAVGMMVSYYGLLEEVKDLKPDDSTALFDRLSVSFAELEKHGFDVADPQSRITKVLSLKDGLAKKAEERICVENKLEEAEREKRKVEEEMAELKRKILELQRREAIAEEEKEAAEKMVVEMKSNAETIEQEFQEMEVEFKETLSAPW